jgi:hypothetical protein
VTGAAPKAPGAEPTPPAALDDGFGGFLVLALVGVLAHEPWRWLGLVIGVRIDPDGALFRWVRAVSNALVAALVARLLFFPVGVLADTSMALRLGALALGIAAFYVGGQRLAVGVLIGCAGLYAGLLAGL